MDYPTISLVISVLGIHLLAVMSPGPDFFMLVRNAMLYSRKAGIYTAIGFGLGIGVHVCYSIFGLALLISNTPIIFNIIKYLGAGYLIYIGVLSFISKTTHFETNPVQESKSISNIKAIRIGFLTNVLNPKATMFFLSLFTAVIGAESNKSLVIFLGIAMMINTTLWFSLLSILLTHSKILPFLEKNQGLFNKIFGILLVGIGLQIMVSSLL